jgi:hypothetical protein
MMSCSHDPGIDPITPDVIEGFKSKARLERARAIQRALRRLTGRHERATG